MSSPDGFVERYWRLTMWLARRRVGRTGGALDLADARSDAALGLWRAARSFDPTRGRSEASWVTYCVDHDITEGIRRRLHRKDAPVIVELDDAGAATVGPPEVEAAIDLHRAIRLLTKPERRLVYAYYWESRTLLELAGELGVSEGRVSQMLTSVRARLRRTLKYGPAPVAAVLPIAAPPVRRPRRRPTTLQHPVLCHECGALFLSRLPNARYCSDSHRQSAYRGRLKTSAA